LWIPALQKIRGAIMAARMTRKAVVAIVSRLKFVCMLLVVIGLSAVAAWADPPAEPTPFQEVQPQAEQVESAEPADADSAAALPETVPTAPVAKPAAKDVQTDNSSSPPSTAVFWTIAASCLLLVGLALGAVAAWVVLYGRRAIQRSDDESNDASHSLVGAIRSRFLARKIKLLLFMRRIARSTKSRLRAMIPTRRTVVRILCLLTGTALVALSLYGFTIGRIGESSILLPIGYFIAASYWLLAWKRQQSGPDIEELEYLAAASEPPSPAPRPAAVRPQIVAPARPPIHAPIMSPPAPHVEFTVHTVASPAAETVDNITAETVDNISAAVAFHPMSPLPPGYAAQLLCAPCGKQFNVRGQGEIAYRLVPCPACGSPMQSLGPKRNDIIPNDPNWVPIVSVFCKSCRSLIDVPYSTFGSSIPCPRCQADMVVPNVNHRSAERTPSELASV
jgi:hypothetical protein